ncbi:MAG TPA: hypothetical protein VK774_02830 [Solirubrobacteraceae bacterium]|nr:hypothetical protein [Solirubrobacteraceae bacterium]
MAKAHARAKFCQAGDGGRGCGLETDAEPLGRAPDERAVPERFGGGDQQQPPGVGRQLREAPGEAALDCSCESAAWGEHEAGCELLGRQPPRQLEDRQGIAAGFGDDPIAHMLVERGWEHRAQETPCRALVETADHQLGEFRRFRLVVGGAHGKNEGDRFG